MKLNKITAYFAAFAALAFSSCSEGQYWDEASNPGEVYAFAKPAQTLSIAASESFPSSFDVVISRNSSKGNVTVPVTFTPAKGSESILSGAAEVSFADGSNSATYTINISNGARAGLNYSATLSLEQPKDALVHVDSKNLEYTFNISQVLVLKWEDKGVANAFSKWAGNETPIEIPVQEATNWPIDGQHRMRLVSPYWYLEPAVASEGANLEFYLDDNWDAQKMFANWQYIGESDEGYGYFFFGALASYGGYFANEGNIYVMNGVIGYAASPTATTASAGWYETIQFQWTGRPNE